MSTPYPKPKRDPVQGIFRLFGWLLLVAIIYLVGVLVYMTWLADIIESWNKK